MSDLDVADHDDMGEDMTKEKILEFVRSKRDTATENERPFLAAIYFVLKHRTEENWGPKELTMDVAMRME